MLRSRPVLFAALLGLVLLPRPGWSARRADTLDRLEARAEALQERSFEGEEISVAEIQELESEFISLLHRDPENRGVATRLASFYGDWYWNLKRPAPALLELVRTSRDPAGLVQVFVERVGEGPYPLQAQIVLAALSSRPSDPVLWDLAAKASPDVAWKIAFQEEAFRVRLASPSSSSDTPATPVLATRWLSRLLANGFLHRALVAYRELPPGIRASIDSAALGGGPGPGDLRLELAVAAFLDGDRETAGRLLRLATPDPVAERPPERQVWQDTRLILRRLLEHALAAPSDDGFDLLTEPFQGLGPFDRELARSLLTARLAQREAYPALAAYELDRVASLLRDESEPFEPDASLPAHVQTRKDGIGADRESLLRGLEDEARTAEAAARTALGPDPMAPGIARLLAATPAAPIFAERPLPKGIKPVRLSDEKIEARLKEEAQRAQLPSGLYVVRVERKGERIAAIVASQALDPVGEISAGAYWVLLSEDGGATWGAPLYTGLRINQPYVVRRVSNLPLFDGDRLRLEVEVRELDSSLISFPPISLPVKRSAEGLFLELPLAALTRDSDEDGLTDLAETRLLTDPHAADSDGDGLADGGDLLPGSPQADDASTATQALAAVVKRIAGVGGRALIEGVDGTPAGVTCCGRRAGPPVVEPTVFFIGERPLFAGLRPDRRVVVLTRAEAEAAEKTFGPFFPLQIELFLFDHSGRRALVIWSASWQGGTLNLEEKDGQWTVTEVLSWIT